MKLTSNSGKSLLSRSHSCFDNWKRFRRAERGRLCCSDMTSRLRASRSCRARPRSSAVLFHRVAMSRTIRRGLILLLMQAASKSARMVGLLNIRLARFRSWQSVIECNPYKADTMWFTFVTANLPRLISARVNVGRSDPSSTSAATASTRAASLSATEASISSSAPSLSSFSAVSLLGSSSRSCRAASSSASSVVSSMAFVLWLNCERID